MRCQAARRAAAALNNRYTGNEVRSRYHRIVKKVLGSSVGLDPFGNIGNEGMGTQPYEVCEQKTNPSQRRPFVGYPAKTEMLARCRHET